MADSASQRVVAITGGSSGIGLATAERFARDGWHVEICGRNRERLAQALERLQALGASSAYASRVDVRHREAVDSFVDSIGRRHGRLDGLVNNAGVAPLAPVPASTDDDLSATLETNCHAVFFATRAAWPIFRRQQGGAIINISSLASTDPFDGFSLYGASKAWVNLFTRACANEGAPLGIRAVAVCPGAVDTPLLQRLFPKIPADHRLAPEAVAEFVWQIAIDPGCVESGSAVEITVDGTGGRLSDAGRFPTSG